VKSLVDERRFLRDPSITDWSFNQWVDLTVPLTEAAAVGMVKNGKRVVAKTIIDDSTVVIVKAIVPYAYRRVNADNPANADPSEYVEMIFPKDATNFFCFEPQVDGKAAIGIAFNNAGAWTAALNAIATDTKPVSGITFISDDPYAQAHIIAHDALRGCFIGPKSELTVLFTVIADAITGPLPGRYEIVPRGSAPSAPSRRRVDYAGVYMLGEQMSKQHYDECAEERKRRLP
jgi:hypothetical protein